MKTPIAALIVLAAIVGGIFVYQSNGTQQPKANPELTQVNEALSQVNDLYGKLDAQTTVPTEKVEAAATLSTTNSATPTSTLDADSARQILNSVRSILEQLAVQLQNKK